MSMYTWNIKDTSATVLLCHHSWSNVLLWWSGIAVTAPLFLVSVLSVTGISIIIGTWKEKGMEQWMYV